MSIELITANALDLPLSKDTVDLIVTSPPYFGLRSYQDGGEHYAGQIGDEATPTEFIDALVAATREMIRVTKPTGSIWVNLGDKYAGSTGTSGYSSKSTLAGFTNANTKGRQMAAVKPRKITTHVAAKSLHGIPWRYALRCIDDLGLILREEVIWAKPNGLPESVKDRCARKHEQWFHFTLSSKYHADMNPIREEPVGGWKPGGKKKYEDDNLLSNGQQPHKSLSTTTGHPLGKLPGSVWTVPTQPLTVPKELGLDHYAAFPMFFPARIIQGWCPAEGVVLDPFGGTGTTALVADVLGRTGISVDLSNDYGRIAEWRTNDPKQRKKAVEVCAKVAATTLPLIPEQRTE